MHLTVTDFQSLGHVSVEVSGLTVLVGPSNRGKSALIRALEAVLFNKPGDEFVRSGKKRAVVEILDAPGLPHQVTWTKGGGKTIYALGDERLNIETYSKVGQGTPPPITEGGYRDVWIGDKDRKKGEWLRPQVSEQGPGTYFLLNRTGAFVSDVLGAISRHAVLLTAQGRAAGDHRGTKQQLGYKQTELTTAHEQLDALDAVPAFAARVAALVAVQAQVDALRAKVARVKSLLLWRALYARLGAAPLPAATPPLLDERLWANITRGRVLAAARPRLLAVGGSEVPAPVTIPELPNVAKARGLVGWRGKVATLAQLRTPNSTWPEVLPKVDQIERATSHLAGVVGRRTQALDMLYRCETAVKSTKVEAEEARAALKALFDGLKICPVCEKVL